MPASDYERCATILRPRSLTTPFLQPMSQRGPTTFNGRSQIVSPDAGYWTMRMGLQIVTRDQLLEFRGMVTDMQGGLRPYRFRIFDERQAPLTSYGVDSSRGVPHSNGEYFDTGYGYVQSDIILSLRESIEIGSTEAKFDVIAAGELKRGMFFSCRSRLFQIVRPPEYLSNSRVNVSVLPPAREAVASAFQPEFANPEFLARLASPNTGRVDLRDVYYGEPELDLEESFDGLS